MAQDAYISKGLLRPCEKNQHGVSTNPASAKNKKMEAIQYPTEAYAPAIKDKIKSIIQKNSKAALKKNGEYYLHFTVKAAFGVVDDLEVLLIPEKRTIHFRSVASKWWDFGRNRERVEDIIKAFQKK